MSQPNHGSTALLKLPLRFWLVEAQQGVVRSRVWTVVDLPIVYLFCGACQPSGQPVSKGGNMMKYATQDQNRPPQ